MSLAVDDCERGACLLRFSPIKKWGHVFRNINFFADNSGPGGGGGGGGY